MEHSLKVSRIESLPFDLGELVAASLREEFFGVQRLSNDWHQGSNRFAERGEALFEARLERRLVAICGLNQDPYSALDAVGRLRHLYVAPDRRRLGVGKVLTTVVLSYAASSFRTVRLRTDRPDADRFYLALGFTRSWRTPESTHEIQLST